MELILPRFGQEAELAFELGLLRLGITLDEDQRNYLNCYGTLFAPSYEEGRLIVHSWELEYRKTVVIQGGQQFATTWDDSAVGVVARDDLSRADMGEWCGVNP